MADLRALQDFAAAHAFGLTHPLSNAQVVRLAEYWLPQIFFYPAEKFHPIALDEAFSMIDALFQQIPADARDEWRVSKVVRSEAGIGQVRAFDPPVVHMPDGVVPFGTTFADAVRVIDDGRSAAEALEHQDVDQRAVVTHGASFTRSNQFFGASVTFSGGNVPTANDPFLPRATVETANGPRPRITVLAAYKNLLDTVKYELTIEEAGNYPPDALWDGIGIARTLLRPTLPGIVLTPEERRQILLELIAAYEAGDLSAEPVGLPAGWVLDKKAWAAVTSYAFLEYEFFYAYNDWDRYQTTPFENEHEGDDEGCCLVFNRRVIDVAAAGGAPELLLQAVPDSIITSVHEEIQNADLFKLITPPVPPTDDETHLPREDIDLSVYVAAGSHATYLTPGTHDVVDFGDAWSYVVDAAPILVGLSWALPIAALVSIIDHFVDTEDFTSDDGIRVGPDEVVGDHELRVAHRTVVLPMSRDRHIYRRRHEDLLRLRAFPGKWGDHDGPVDKSPNFSAKTGRYFRKLLRNV